MGLHESETADGDLRIGRVEAEFGGGRKLTPLTQKCLLSHGLGLTAARDSSGAKAYFGAQVAPKILLLLL